MIKQINQNPYLIILHVTPSHIVNFLNFSYLASCTPTSRVIPYKHMRAVRRLKNINFRPRNFIIQLFVSGPCIQINAIKIQQCNDQFAYVYSQHEHSTERSCGIDRRREIFQGHCEKKTPTIGFTASNKLHTRCAQQRKKTKYIFTRTMRIKKSRSRRINTCIMYLQMHTYARNANERISNASLYVCIIMPQIHRQEKEIWRMYKIIFGISPLIHSVRPFSIMHIYVLLLALFYHRRV